MIEITEQSLRVLVAGFEDGSWPVANWKHTHHVMLAACYILDHEDALERLRTNIPRYNVSQGGQNTPDSGYHETLTCFWYETIRDFLAALPPGMSRVEAVTRAVDEYTPKRDLFREYYDFDVVKSREARSAWIPPGVRRPTKDPQQPDPVKSTVPE